MASIVPVTTEVIDSFTAPVTPAGGAVNTTDLQINKNYPALIYTGTESNSVYEEVREVAGDLWMATNATFNTTSLNWIPNNIAQAVFATVNRGTGATQRLYCAAGITPIVWVQLWQVDAQGALSSTPQPFVTGVNALSLTPTWNNVAINQTGVKLNVTDTASNAASLLMDLQKGGTSQFNVSKIGAVTQASTLTVSSGGANVTGTVAASALQTSGPTTVTYAPGWITSTGATVASNFKVVYGTASFFGSATVNVPLTGNAIFSTGYNVIATSIGTNVTISASLSSLSSIQFTQSGGGSPSFTYIVFGV